MSTHRPARDRRGAAAAVARASRPRPVLRRAGAGLGAMLTLVGLAVVVSGPGRPVAAAPATADESAARQAALVAAEDRRLIQIRSVTAVAPLRGGTEWSKPYRLTTGSGYTLVLTSRSNPYTIADLLKLAPQTFVRQSDGSYLLLENLYLNPGAKLLLANPGGLALRMASTSAGFVSIVSFGGSLSLSGTQQAPVRVSSWDPRTKKGDTDPTDGRAYLRAVGGQFTMSYARVAELGFWSGRTGGLSLTGTDRPDTGATAGPEAHRTKAQRHEDKKTRLTEDPVRPAEVPTAGDVYAQPSGELTTPDSRFEVAEQSYVSASIKHSTVNGNAYGLFVSSADGIEIRDTTVEGSLIDGVILHRFASNGIIERVTSNGNAGDGFVLARATQEIRISGAVANGNGNNGITMTGRALAEGPSPSGETVGGYGNNSVANSQFRDNARYGIEVDGGTDVGVQNNQVSGGDMGIVARRAADRVSIVGNQLSGQARHGISIRDGVTAATVTGNMVEASPTGIYLRASVATVRGNTVDRVTLHGVTVVGAVKGTQVAYNTVSGTGPTAVDTARSSGRIKVERNQTAGWHDTRSLMQQLQHWGSPMTLLWVGVGLLIVVSALRARKLGARGSHPYASQQALPVSEGQLLVPSTSPTPTPATMHSAPAPAADAGRVPVRHRMPPLQTDQRPSTIPDPGIDPVTERLVRPDVSERHGDRRGDRPARTGRVEPQPAGLASLLAERPEHADRSGRTDLPGGTGAAGQTDGMAGGGSGSRFELAAGYEAEGRSAQRRSRPPTTSGGSPDLPGDAGDAAGSRWADVLPDGAGSRPVFDDDHTQVIRQPRHPRADSAWSTYRRDRGEGRP